ncbi:MAG: twin-arginine translocation signal domain-containing protein, partial [Selenomonadaceae bacterium]|nr:twin-arginine translocation signal domain-containing protein [Selenomonadaceae bacterium]
MDISRRNFFKLAGVAAVGAAVGQIGTHGAEAAVKTPKLNAAPVVG